MQRKKFIMLGAASALLFANRITDRNRPVHDFTGELNITKEAQLGATSHKFTLGGFYGNASARVRWSSAYSCLRVLRSSSWRA